jgi:hypothetical protein
MQQFPATRHERVRANRQYVENSLRIRFPARVRAEPQSHRSGCVLRASTPSQFIYYQADPGALGVAWLRLERTPAVLFTSARACRMERRVGLAHSRVGHLSLQPFDSPPRFCPAIPGRVWVKHVLGRTPMTVVVAEAWAVLCVDGAMRHGHKAGPCSTGHAGGVGSVVPTAGATVVAWTGPRPACHQSYLDPPSTKSRNFSWQEITVSSPQ